ncbi:hypothetical protein [Thalassomonas viridans]|nr:hypothetical protein [Thalassomonas viridans]
MHCLEQLANKEVGLELLLPWQVNIS